MIGAIYAAHTGIRSAQNLMSSTANNLANVSTPDFQQAPRPAEAPAIAPSAGNNVDIAEQMVNMTIANLTTKANVASAQTAINMYEDILKLGSSH